MSYYQLSIKSFELCYSNKVLLSDCSIEVPYCGRIGIIGRNGSGKSSLLNYIYQHALETKLNVEYVTQLMVPQGKQSGGQCLSQRLHQSLAKQPELLLLDEPTNHLDLHNRASLFQALKRFYGTLIIVSHDQELLSKICQQIWTIEHTNLLVFDGNYQNYLQQRDLTQDKVTNAIKSIDKQLKQNHLSLMKEQQRASNSRKKGFKNIKSKKYPTIKSVAKANRSIKTSDQNKKALHIEKQNLQNELNQCQQFEQINPNFHLARPNSHGMVLSISQASIGYSENSPIITELNLSLHAKERLWLQGNNGSGKSTLLKAIMAEQTIWRSGEWLCPQKSDVGYLDQHYQNLDPELSIIDNLSRLVPDWSHLQLRKHLNDFLFKKNEEVELLAQFLSGGEQVRLSLALIAAKSPKLLILDEITNNLDIETKAHVKTLINRYPGAIILVCHEPEFIKNTTDNTLKELKL